MIVHEAMDVKCDWRYDFATDLEQISAVRDKINPHILVQKIDHFIANAFTGGQRPCGRRLRCLLSNDRAQWPSTRELNTKRARCSMITRLDALIPA